MPSSISTPTLDGTNLKALVMGTSKNIKGICSNREKFIKGIKPNPCSKCLVSIVEKKDSCLFREGIDWIVQWTLALS